MSEVPLSTNGKEKREDKLLFFFHYIFQLLSQAIKSVTKVACILGPFYFIYMMVKELAGEITFADIDIFADFFNEAIETNKISWTITAIMGAFALFMVILYIISRRENQKLTDRYGNIAQKYEQMIDNKRTSSQLKNSKRKSKKKSTK